MTGMPGVASQGNWLRVVLPPGFPKEAPVLLVAQPPSTPHPFIVKDTGRVRTPGVLLTSRVKDPRGPPSSPLFRPAPAALDSWSYPQSRLVTVFQEAVQAIQGPPMPVSLSQPALAQTYKQQRPQGAFATPPLPSAAAAAAASIARKPEPGRPGASPPPPPPPLAVVVGREANLIDTGLTSATARSALQHSSALSTAQSLAANIDDIVETMSTPELMNLLTNRQDLAMFGERSHRPPTGRTAPALPPRAQPAASLTSPCSSPRPLTRSSGDRCGVPDPSPASGGAAGHP